MKAYTILGKRGRRQPAPADVARPRPQLVEHVRGGRGVGCWAGWRAHADNANANVPCALRCARACCFRAY
eukprot:6757356-Alexandrium_andersonii.AAC.1